MMVAGGPFIEDGCKIPDLKVAEGTSTLDLDLQALPKGVSK